MLSKTHYLIGEPMTRPHVAFFDLTEAPLLPELDAVAREHGTTRSQALRAAVQAGLPLLRRGEKPVPPPRRVGRPARTTEAAGAR